MISDDSDDDFAADLKAAEQEMQKKAEKGLKTFQNGSDNEEGMNPNAAKNAVAMAHEKYNTDNLMGGIQASGKKKKKKKKPKKVVNNTAIVEGNNFAMNNNDLNFQDHQAQNGNLF